MLGASFVIWLLFKTASSVPVTIFSMINDEAMLYSQFIHLSFIHLFLNGKLTGKGRTSVNHWVGLIWDCMGTCYSHPQMEMQNSVLFLNIFVSIFIHWKRLWVSILYSEAECFECRPIEQQGGKSQLPRGCDILSLHN